MKLLLDIQTINVEQITDLDEMMAALAIANTVDKQFTSMDVPSPEWLRDKIDNLNAEVKARYRDMLRLRLKQAEQRVDRLKSREDQRAEATAEVERLRKALS